MSGKERKKEEKKEEKSKTHKTGAWATCVVRLQSLSSFCLRARNSKIVVAVVSHLSEFGAETAPEMTSFLTTSLLS